MNRWPRNALVWTHRYLGIPLSLLFLMWFLTGIGMIYSRGMPRLTPEIRLARLTPLDLGQVRLTPTEAARRVGNLGQALQATLLTVLDRPAYRFTGRGSTTVFADNGELFSSLELDEAALIASRFLGVPPAQIRHGEVITEPDQWTLTLGNQLPLYKLLVDDDAGTEVYVAPRLGEVVQLTNRRGRALSWVSVIPHFLYFKALRMNGELWNQLMVWGPGLGIILSLVGILLGVIGFKPSSPFRLSRISSYIPYRGWLRWHHAAGLVFGVLTLTFVFSGLLSMEPWAWTTDDNSLEAETRIAFPSSTGTISDYPAIDAEVWNRRLGMREIKEVSLTQVLGQPHFVVRSAPSEPPRMGWPDGGHQPYFVERSVDPERRVIPANTLRVRDTPISADVILARLASAVSEATILRAEMLSDYDAYYYSREGRSPLPVLRVQLEDPDQTWLYIDPEVAHVVGRINRVNRMERWLYAGLHTFDFPFLYDRRPLWDVVVILFCLGGALISGIGLLLGVKRTAVALNRFTVPSGA